MEPALRLTEPPSLDPAWLAHEQKMPVKTIVTDPLERQQVYSKACKALNTTFLDEYLTKGLDVQDSHIQVIDHSIPIRTYTSTEIPKNGEESTVIYYHGGGLCVGDLESEDFSCRRICKAMGCTVYSVDYRLMPQYTADDALVDALSAFKHISNLARRGKLILVGSSSGGQLAAQVSQFAVEKRINGVLLRCPVLCDAANLPLRFQSSHTSMSTAFFTSLLSVPALTNENRTNAKLPLEEKELKRLPRHWIQMCTNDIYYSDAACYVEALRENDVEVKIDVVWGWPHTFWLKAPGLDRARKADLDMIDGLRWLLES